ncbi:MAG TPA: dihydrodipicolinate reductase C-terminal domain-containing protein [Thermoanaerobaculia bacterium]|nr:dihydrodipicolinate reductase C-terminal domain-containing protein [Thermoanaerobaculia bacterium]
MKLALNGYGKMGLAVEEIARQRNHEIAVRFDSRNPPVASGLEGVEVLLDFSHADAIEQLVAAACEAKVDLVIGTTGWDDRREAIRDRCEAAGVSVVYGSNFSPGANVAFALARHAAALISGLDGYESGIEERHHSQKKDSPSGTALRLARVVGEASEGKLKPDIASSRVGAEFGLHTLFFDSPDDVLEVSHRARGRAAFARGAILAAETIGKKRGFWSFEELMGW